LIDSFGDTRDDTQTIETSRDIGQAVDTEKEKGVGVEWVSPGGLQAHHHQDKYPEEEPSRAILCRVCAHCFEGWSTERRRDVCCIRGLMLSKSRATAAVTERYFKYIQVFVLVALCLQTTGYPFSLLQRSSSHHVFSYCVSVSVSKNILKESYSNYEVLGLSGE
jgi:hypothetical protein